MIINSSQYFDLFNWIFLDKLLDKFYEKTYNNRIKNYKFKIKNTNLKGKNYLVVLIIYHVAVARNISSATENKLANPHKIRENASFSFAKKLQKIT